MSLFDDPTEAPEETFKPSIKAQKKAEEQLILPQVTELDEHHGVDIKALSQKQNTVNFDDYWTLLEPKLKQAAKECFQELFDARKNDWSPAAKKAHAIIAPFFRALARRLEQ